MGRQAWRHQSKHRLCTAWDGATRNQKHHSLALLAPAASRVENLLHEHLLRQAEVRG